MDRPHAPSEAASEPRFLRESFDVTAGPGAHELAKVLFLASELGAWVPLSTSAERRAAQLLFAASLLVVKRGSTYLPAGNVEEWVPTMSELGGTREDALRAFELMNSGRLSPVLGGPSEFKPLLLDRERLFLQRMFACEERVAVHLQQRMLGAVRTSPEALEPLLSSLRESGAPLTEEQEAAVVCAASRSFAAITGGPGTGKTSIVVSMLRILLRLGLAPESIALASPTGKAANRMRESILHALDGATSLSEEDEALRDRCPTPLTLHRLLGWNPATHRFLHHGNNPIPADLVIVDEASMIDTFMADALLKALKPATRLVLLGDADQLPSVDAGSFFRDITGTKLPGVARLTKSFRMSASNPNGAAILTVARAINSGNAQVFSSRSSGLRAMGHRTLPQDLRFEGVEVFQGDALGRENVLERWHQQKLFATRAIERRVRKVYQAREGLCSLAEDVDDLKALFQHFGARRILTVTREGTSTTSSDGINARLHQSTLRLLRTSSEADGPGPGFYPGDPVMVTSNDYARDLFNGDQGMVLRVQGEARGDHHYGVVFERGGAFVVHPLEPLRRVLDLAYAITTHKSQGSEFEDVMVVLPESPMPLLTREVLYTAVTRAKQSVVLVGSVELLRIAAESPMVRHSALGQHLAMPGHHLNDLER